MSVLPYRTRSPTRAPSAPRAEHAVHRAGAPTRAHPRERRDMAHVGSNFADHLVVVSARGALRLDVAAQVKIASKR
jgi:hypothetical protein